MAGWRSAIPIFGPLLVLAAAGWLWWQSSQTRARFPPVEPADSEPWAAVDFASLKPGDEVPGWEVAQGTLGLAALDRRTVLELKPDPMVEGQFRCRRLITGGGALRARMRGERARRAAPRFCVSFHGDTQIQLRAVPSSQVIEITEKENVLTSVPWTWNPDAWLWLELRVSPPDGSGARAFEGRVWHEGESRPAQPTVHCRSSAVPGPLRAVVQGAPYAMRPIYYDRIGVLVTNR